MAGRPDADVPGFRLLRLHTRKLPGCGLFHVKASTAIGAQTITDTEPTTLSDVVVVGVRAVVGGTIPGGAGPGDPAEPTAIQVEEGSNAPAPVYTEETAQQENERQKECAAKKLEAETKKAGSTANWREHFSHTWISNGQTLTHDAVEGTGTQPDLDARVRLPTRGDFQNARSNYGVSNKRYRCGHTQPPREYILQCRRS